MEFIKHLGITKAVKVAETFLRFSWIAFFSCFVSFLSLIFSSHMDYFFHSNLLRPAGVGLQDAVFTFKVYRAEDLPQSKLIR